MYFTTHYQLNWYNINCKKKTELTKFCNSLFFKFIINRGKLTLVLQYCAIREMHLYTYSV